MSESKVLKAPLIEDEVCFLEAPELVLELTKAEQEQAVAEEELAPVSETVPEKLTSEGEEPTLDLKGEEEPEFDSKEEAERILHNAQEQAEQLLSSTRQEADLILENAKQEVDQLKEEAEQQLSLIKKEAYETGYQEGLNEGRKEAQIEWEEKLAAAETALTKAQQESSELIKRAEEERVKRILSSEEEILKLAFDIAEKIISTQLERSPSSWLPMINEAVKKVAGATELTIRVSEQDEAFLIQHLKTIRSQLSESPQIKLVSDSTLKPGELFIQSNLGQVDARISQQLERIYRTLKDEGGQG